MKQIIDLHMHSCYSDDGEYTPAELVQMCVDAGIEQMAIADHNCVKGVGEGMKAAKRLGIQYTPAVEIDCTYQNVDFHILGYGIQHESPEFEEVEQNIRRQCIRASQERLRLVRELGFDISEEALAAVTAGTYWSESWTGEVFAEVLLDSEAYRNSELLLPYRAGGARSDNPYVNFYWDYCAQGKPCYVKTTFPDFEEVIKLIHRNGGTAVLAHPGNNLKGRLEMLEELMALGLDGLEAFSSYHDEATAQWFADQARRHGLETTRGSDFHGKAKPSVRLGVCGR